MVKFLSITVPVHEFEITYSRSSGPGGQNVNKVNSRCTLRWCVTQSQGLPAAMKSRFLLAYGSQITQAGEILISSDRYRDQKRNYEDCIQKITQWIKAVEQPPKPRKKTKPSRGSKLRLRSSKQAHSEKKALRKKH